MIKIMQKRYYWLLSLNIVMNETIPMTKGVTTPSQTPEAPQPKPYNSAKIPPPQPKML